MGRSSSIVLFMFAVSATPALSCEPPRGYRIPTNIELVQNADLIVLARVSAGPQPETPMGDRWRNPSPVFLDPVEILKGALTEKLPSLYGMTIERSGERVEPVLTRLFEAHPSVEDGGCVREKYAIGALVVAMFRRAPAGLKLLSFPFARQVEDVAGPNSTWVRAVRYYVKASTGGPSDQKRAFIALKRTLVGDSDAEDQEIAKDIGRYLSIGPRTAGRPMNLCIGETC